MRRSPSVGVKGPPACVTACVHLSLLGLPSTPPTLWPTYLEFFNSFTAFPQTFILQYRASQTRTCCSYLEDWLSPSPWVPSPESLPHEVRAGCRARLLNSSRSGRCRHLPHCPPPNSSPSGEAENHLGGLKSEKELNMFRFCVIYFVYLITK